MRVRQVIGYIVSMLVMRESVRIISSAVRLKTSSTSMALKTFTVRSQGFYPPVIGVDDNQYTVNSCAATPKDNHYPDGIYYFKSYIDGTQEEVSLIKGS